MEHVFLFSQLSRKLPSRTVGHSWELVYSTMIHGITLSTLYRNFQGYDSPVLIVVKDEHQRVSVQSEACSGAELSVFDVCGRLG